MIPIHAQKPMLQPELPNIMSATRTTADLVNTSYPKLTWLQMQCIPIETVPPTDEQTRQVPVVTSQV